MEQSHHTLRGTRLATSGFDGIGDWTGLLKTKSEQFGSWNSAEETGK
jgi:hypothetical protein